MATVKKTMKKAQTGKNVPKGMVESEMFPGKMIPKSKSNYYNGEYNKMVETGRSRTEAARKAFDAKAKAKPKAQNGVKKSLTPAPVKKTGMDAVKDLGKYVSTFGLAKDKYNPATQREQGIKKMPKSKMQKGGKKAKSFPDLNKDGKVTKADILKGRGVIAKKGAKVSAMKKCKYGCK